MKHRILMTLLGAGAAFALPALAGPDLTGKSPAFVTAYNAAYNQCLTHGKRTNTARKKPADIAACEQSALAAANAAPAAPVSYPTDKITSPEIGTNPILDKPVSAEERPPLVLSQEVLDNLKDQSDPNIMTLTIPIDIEGFPTTLLSNLPEDRRFDAFYVTIRFATYADEDGRWKQVKYQGLSLKLDFPPDGRLKTDMQIPLSGEGKIFTAQELRYFGNTANHRLSLRINFDLYNTTDNRRASISDTWESERKSLPGADVTYVIDGIYQQGKWVRLHRSWSGPIPDEFVTNATECDRDAIVETNPLLLGHADARDTPYYCEVIAQ